MLLFCLALSVFIAFECAQIYVDERPAIAGRRLFALYSRHREGLRCKCHQATFHPRRPSVSCWCRCFMLSGICFFSIRFGSERHRLHHRHSGKESDRLVQWCHGATGWIPFQKSIRGMLLLLHYRSLTVFFIFVRRFVPVAGAERSSPPDAAHRAVVVVCQRGLLTTGPGLCHGVAGSGYAFLGAVLLDAALQLIRVDSCMSVCASALHRCDPSQRLLNRAHLFAQWAAEHADHRQADTPYSLFEGSNPSAFKQSFEWRITLTHTFV